MTVFGFSLARLVVSGCVAGVVIAPLVHRAAGLAPVKDIAAQGFSHPDFGASLSVALAAQICVYIALGRSGLIK